MRRVLWDAGRRQKTGDIRAAMQFFVYRQDKPGTLELRMQTRPAHMDYAASLGDTLVFAGPTMDADGNMNGSVWIVEADSVEHAHAITEADPFEQVALFETKVVRRFVRTAGTGYGRFDG